ncbi:MAG: hypothetical protein N4A31_01015 [Rickettsiales bacterium]|jgi:hypothetical protein|nr:hypothetical protein [Rickettsiales bacterium]
MPQDSLEDLMGSYKNAFKWVNKFIKDIDFNKESPTFATIPINRMGEDKVAYIRNLNIKMNIELEVVSRLYKEISAIIETLESNLETDPNITISQLLKIMKFYPDESIALFTGNMPSVLESARAADLLPQMIETRDSLDVAYYAVLAVYQINDVTARGIEGTRNEADSNRAEECVEYIKKIKVIRTEILNKRKAAEQEIKDAQAKEDSKEDGEEHDGKPTAEEFDEMQANSSCEPSSAPSSIPTGMPNAMPTGVPIEMPTEMSGGVYAVSLLMFDESF